MTSKPSFSIIHSLESVFYSVCIDGGLSSSFTNVFPGQNLSDMVKMVKVPYNYNEACFRLVGTMVRDGRSTSESSHWNLYTRCSQ